MNNKVAESKCGKIAVTESLTVEKGAIVKLTNHPYSGSGFDAYDWVVLTLPASKGTIPLENFVCPDMDGIPPCTLSTNLVNGVWQLVIRKAAHDVLQMNDDTDTTISHALPSACTNAASWKSGNAPTAGMMYIAADGAVDLSANPFGGALPVAFDFPGGAPEDEPTAMVAVATVADAAKAQSLDLSARKILGYSVKFPTRANADGTVTILAKFFKPAFIMVVR